METKGCDHCFCKQDESGNPKCCKCGAVLMPCDKCPLKYCQLKEIFERRGWVNLQVLDCPLVTPRYVLLYKARSLTNGR